MPHLEQRQLRVGLLCEGAPAGFVAIVPRDDGNADLDGPFVEPDLWGGGIGRKLVDAQVPRPAGERAVRWLLKEGLTSPLFAPAMAIGKALRPLVPAALTDKVPGPAPARAHDWPTREHARKVLLLAGCVQFAVGGSGNLAGQGAAGLADGPEQRALGDPRLLKPVNHGARGPALQRQAGGLVLAGGLGLPQPDPDEAPGGEVVKADVLDVQGGDL